MTRKPPRTQAPDKTASVPSPRRSAGEYAADALRKAILDGQLAPGERLTEETLAQMLEISRTPVREALRILTADGLLVRTAYQGVVVRSYTAAELEEVYELRALLEGHACRRAATRITKQGISELLDSCSRFQRLVLEEGVGVEEIVKENATFHGLILEVAASIRLTDMVRSVTAMPLVYRAYVWYSPNQKHLADSAHLDLTGALARGDGEAAAEIMQTHILTACELLLEHLKALEAHPATDPGSPSQDPNASSTAAIDPPTILHAGKTTPKAAGTGAPGETVDLLTRSS